MINYPLKEILELLDKMVGIDKSKISLSTTVNKDLRIEGDDAAEFIDQFATLFNVDRSEFIFEKYFINEGFAPLGYIKGLFKTKQQKEPLSIAHLLKSVEDKKLV